MPQSLNPGGVINNVIKAPKVPPQAKKVAKILKKRVFLFGQRLAIKSVTYNGNTVTADNAGVYNIVLENSISRIAYTYDGQGEGSDNVFILTEDVDGSVSQISIESSDTADFGSYPIPYGVEITDAIKSEYNGRHSKKIGYVLDESGNPGRFELDIAISLAGGM